MQQLQTREPRPPRQLDDSIPRELDRLCLKMLAKQAAERPSTALDVAADLRRWLANAPAHERQDLDAVRERLSRLLGPLSFEAEVSRHLPRFTGRQWVFDRLDAWLADPGASRVFWVTGAP